MPPNEPGMNELKIDENMESKLGLSLQMVWMMFLAKINVIPSECG